MTPVEILAAEYALAKPGRSKRVLGSHFYQPSRLRTLKTGGGVSAGIPGNTAPMEALV